MKLFQYLQQQGMSRRKIFSLVQEGKIFLNGEKNEDFNKEITGKDVIEIIREGEKKEKFFVEQTKKKKSQMILFYKPDGYVVSKSDHYNHTIYDLLPSQYKNWYYVGRLDKDSEGLLMMVSDPTVVNEYERAGNYQKVYEVLTDRIVTTKDIEVMKKGIYVDEYGDKLPEGEGEFLRIIGAKPGQGRTVFVTLDEGRKRHIRRLMRGLKYRVLSLKRISFGDYKLGDMQKGEWKKV